MWSSTTETVEEPIEDDEEAEKSEEDKDEEEKDEHEQLFLVIVSYWRRLVRRRLWYSPFSPRSLALALGRSGDGYGHGGDGDHPGCCTFAKMRENSKNPKIQ